MINEVTRNQRRMKATQTSKVKAPKTFKVFVYGSLLKGLGNHRFLDHEDATLVGQATLEPQQGLAMIDATGGSFPHVGNAKGFGLKPTAIKGEVYEVDGETVSELDRLEGVPDHYKRVRRPVQLDGGSENVFMYEAADPWEYKGFPQVEDGDWKRWLSTADQREASPSMFDDDRDDEEEGDQETAMQRMRREAGLDDDDQFDYSIGM